MVHLELALLGAWSSEWRPLWSEQLEDLLERCKAQEPLQLPLLGSLLIGEMSNSRFDHAEGRGLVGVQRPQKASTDEILI